MLFKAPGTTLVKSKIESLIKELFANIKED